MCILSTDVIRIVNSTLSTYEACTTSKHQTAISICTNHPAIADIDCFQSSTIHKQIRHTFNFGCVEAAQVKGRQARTAREQISHVRYMSRIEAAHFKAR